MASRNGRGRSAVPFANQVKAYKLLEEALIKTADNRVLFKEDWGDERVSGEAGISRALAASIRLKNFGVLAKHPEPNKRRSLKDDFTGLMEDLIVTRALCDANASVIRTLTSEVRSIWELLEKMVEKKDA